MPRPRSLGRDPRCREVRGVSSSRVKPCVGAGEVGELGSAPASATGVGGAARSTADGDSHPFLVGG
eukprot:2209445-Pyramimonas_sp.AAC.1